MKILGMGIPELLILFFVLFIIVLPIVIIILVVQRSSERRAPVDPKQQASAVAYQRLAQLDDLRKRGVITEEEFAEKKQQLVDDL